MRFENKVAVVTGGASGIGLAAEAAGRGLRARPPVDIDTR